MSPRPLSWLLPAPGQTPSLEMGSALGPAPFPVRRLGSRGAGGRRRGRWGKPKAEGASLRRKYFGCGGRGAGRLAPPCAQRPTCSARRALPVAPDLSPAQCLWRSPRPRPPPGAGRAGGVVRAARVTASSSRGASTGRSVTAHSPPRAARVGGAMPREPAPQPESEPGR